MMDKKNLHYLGSFIAIGIEVAEQKKYFFSKVVFLCLDEKCWQLTTHFKKI